LYSIFRGNKMSEKQLNESMATGEQPNPTLVEQLRTLCPHFFTGAIERHRKGGSAVPEKPKRQLWASVTRDLGEGACTFVYLHFVRPREFELRDNSGESRWPVNEDYLQQAICSRGFYVSLKLGTETFRLKRAELLFAFRRLRTLQTET
jgi:hypothetical protein